MYQANKHERDLLSFWEQDNTFYKSVAERPRDALYVFYDGPPFATGLPHYGHIVASTMKDAVPRFWTMRGKRVERVWGWDCHGLPIENIVEKELGTKSKKDIEENGVGAFNELCRSKVLSYVDEWKKTITRLGRWVDMDQAYRTMDLSYMESVWWVFKQLWDKELIYKGYRPMHICPRCETTLSQQEVSEGYKDIKDLSVVAKLAVRTDTNTVAALSAYTDAPLYLLVWTTTPWTLPGNILAAVGSDIEYSVVKYDGAYFVVAKELVMSVFEGKEWQVVDSMLGKDLVGVRYEPLFPYFTQVDGAENGFRVVTADFVAATEGTGIVHIAPAFGSDDYEIFRQEQVPFIQHVGMNGRFIDAVTDFAGMHVKPAEDHMATDVEIIKWLAQHGMLFSKKKYEHSYPHCWRCDTPLLNYATDSWFVNVTKIKPRALELAERISWSPEHMKEGRFGKWLEGARDWSISRQRFWATTIPIWQNEDGDMICFGSVQELETLSGKTITDLHKHVLDEVTFEHNGTLYRRVPDVLDTWFDSGSMPYAQLHYPFEHREQFEQGFPAEYIGEGQDQTRAWFYYLHILGTAIADSPAFTNVIVNGIVLAEDGKKMSKKLKNYPDPNELIERYGADALRYYILSSPVVNAESLHFSETGVKEVFTKLLNTLYNVVEFYSMFAKETPMPNTLPQEFPLHVLDRWILAKLQVLVQEVTVAMETYKLADATRPIQEFVTELSQWYVRRSRDRFKGEHEQDKQAAVWTLGTVLETLAKVMAPFTPFISEYVYKEIGQYRAQQQTSIHLTMWPLVDNSDDEVLSHMAAVRTIVEMGLSLRKDAGIKVRQPLLKFVVSQQIQDQGLVDIILDELNVKSLVQEDTSGAEWMHKTDGDTTVSLFTTITPELLHEGYVREFVRAINQMRKEQGLTREHRIRLCYQTNDAVLTSVIHSYSQELQNAVLADEITEGEGINPVTVDGKHISFTLYRI